MSHKIHVNTIGHSNGGQSANWSVADRAGLIASIGCAIHCALMPIAIAYLPTLGLAWLADEGFHRWMAILCFALAIAAFLPGWKDHGSMLPIAWGAAGLILLNTAAFGLEGGCCAGCDAPVTVKGASIVPFLTPTGGLLLVVGHLVNHRKRCRCQGDRCCMAKDECGTEA